MLVGVKSVKSAFPFAISTLIPSHVTCTTLSQNGRGLAANITSRRRDLSPIFLCNWPLRSKRQIQPLPLRHCGLPRRPTQNTFTGAVITAAFGLARGYPAWLQVNRSNWWIGFHCSLRFVLTGSHPYRISSQDLYSIELYILPVGGLRNYEHIVTCYDA